MAISDHPLFDNVDLTRVDNMWRPLVLQAIAGLIEREEMCGCQDCVLDVLALALNVLPPRYWVLGGYDAFSPPEKFLEDHDHRRLAEEAVLRGLRMVQANPHH